MKSVKGMSSSTLDIAWPEIDSSHVSCRSKERAKARPKTSCHRIKDRSYEITLHCRKSFMFCLALAFDLEYSL